MRHTTRPYMLAAAATLLLFVVACGGPPADMAADTTPPPSEVWRTDLPTGGDEGDVAPNAYVTTRDGDSVALDTLSGGRPMLLYYFATW